VLHPYQEAPHETLATWALAADIFHDLDEELARRLGLASELEGLYTEDRLSGHFASYEASASGSGTPDEASVMTAKGLYGLTPLLDSRERLGSLAALAPGTTESYWARASEKHGISGSVPPTEGLTVYEVRGDPDPTACLA
jgi:hypothetical protein